MDMATYRTPFGFRKPDCHERQQGSKMPIDLKLAARRNNAERAHSPFATIIFSMTLAL
jgi:hypothetical protein